MSEFDPIDFLETAVETPSHEAVDEMRALLVETLTDAGIETRVDDAGNTLATRGRGTPHIVLNTHIDTVVPHVPAKRDGEILRGRGACDAKGPLAALLDAFLRVDPSVAGGESGRLTLAVTPDEEELSLGAAALDIADGLPRAPGTVEEPTPPDAVIVGEPTDLDVCHAARGRFQGTVRIEGESAHAAEPEAGSNAITGLGPVLDAIERFDDEHGPDPHPDLGPPLLTPTVVEGGAATNQLAAEAHVVLDRRSVPPETAAEFESALEAHLQSATAADLGISFSLTDRESPFLEAFATERDAAVVEALADASDGRVRPFGAAAEASYFAAHAPTVIFGPGVLADEDGPVAHADREYVRLPRVEEASDALTAAITAMLNVEQ
jgi:acetylornithine deacetylase